MTAAPAQRDYPPSVIFRTNPGQLGAGIWSFPEQQAVSECALTRGFTTAQADCQSKRIQYRIAKFALEISTIGNDLPKGGPLNFHGLQDRRDLAIAELA